MTTLKSLASPRSLVSAMHDMRRPVRHVQLPVQLALVGDRIAMSTNDRLILDNCAITLWRCEPRLADSALPRESCGRLSGCVRYVEYSVAVKLWRSRPQLVLGIWTMPSAFHGPVATAATGATHGSDAMRCQPFPARGSESQSAGPEGEIE